MSAPPSFRSAISVRGASKTFVAGVGSCSASVSALHGASVEIRGGEVLLVCGPSGAGKTTLLLCIAGMLHCDAGEVIGGVRRVVYRDLSRATASPDAWPAGGAVLLDSCDHADPFLQSRVTGLIASALANGASVVLAGRDPERLMTFAPAAATISILHLRRGHVVDQTQRGSAVHRVAEAAGGGY